MTKRDRQLNAAAKALLPLIEGYKASQKDEFLQEWYYSLIYLGCRHLEFFCVPHVSKKAHTEAKKHNIQNLSEYTWKRMRAMKLGIFHLDHVTPVSILVNNLIEMESPTAKAVRKCIAKMEVAWILKDENDKLPRTKRNANPWDTYRDKKVFMRERN